VVDPNPKGFAHEQASCAKHHRHHLDFDKTLILNMQVPLFQGIGIDEDTFWERATISSSTTPNAV